MANQNKKPHHVIRELSSKYLRQQKSKRREAKVDRTGPDVSEVINMKDDGSIDREQAIRLLVKRGYREEAAAEMVDDYEAASKLSEATTHEDAQETGYTLGAGPFEDSEQAREAADQKYLDKTVTFVADDEDNYYVYYKDE